MRFLIARTDAIGDTILTMPMAKMIKEKNPDAKVAFLISPQSKDLFKGHLYVDDYWVFDKEWPLFKKLTFLKEKFESYRPTTYIFAGGSHLPSFFSWLKRIPNRAGLKSKIQSFLFLNKGVRQSRSLVEMHESDYNLSLLRPLGFTYDRCESHLYGPHINLSQSEVEKSYLSFKKDVTAVGIDSERELFFIHPGMSGHTLNWPSVSYGRLIRALEKEYPERFTYIISYTPSDEKFLLGIREYLDDEEQRFLKKKVYFFNGALYGLRYFMSILSRASFFVGPSTGTSHIANTLGVKQVAIFSPIKVQSSARWGPFYGHKSCRVVIPDVHCKETFQCSGKSCSYYECMSTIGVDKVKNIILEMKI